MHEKAHHLKYSVYNGRRILYFSGVKKPLPLYYKLLTYHLQIYTTENTQNSIFQQQPKTSKSDLNSNTRTLPILNETNLPTLLESLQTPEAVQSDVLNKECDYGGRKEQEKLMLVLIFNKAWILLVKMHVWGSFIRLLI